MNTFSAPHPSPVRRWLPGAMLALLLVLVYQRALVGEFLWDDEMHVAANPTIVGQLGLKEIWTTAAANYFPLVLTNLWLQHALWGLQPFGYHVVTLACHALCAILLWRLLLALDVPGAWLGAALWALHPVQVESVAWISELKNTQSGVFFLLSILCFAHWLKATESAGGRRFYALALFCALLALLSKPSTVMLPVALALIVWWRRGALRLRDAVWLAPFFALSALASGWAIWEQKFHSGALGAEWSQTFVERLALSGKIVWFYLGKLLWPHPLTFIYARWETAATPLAFLPLAAMLAGLAVLWWPFRPAQGPELAEGRRASRWRPALVAAAFFVALLFPVLGFFDVYFFRYSYVSDHFQYLASIGPLALLGAGLARLPWRICFAAVSALLLGLGSLTWRQTAIFQNNTALWSATVTRTPDAVMAWLNYGDVLSWARRYPESIAAYREAVRLRPTDAEGHNNLGNVLALAGDPAAAVPELERAVTLKPDFAVAHYNLGNALRALDRHAEAQTAFAAALRLKPDYAGAHNNLGVELVEAGRPDEAIPHLEFALRAKPDAAPARASLLFALDRHGRDLLAAGRWPEAAAAYQRAIELAPASAALHDQLGEVLRALARNREALEQFELAAKLRNADPRRP